MAGNSRFGINVHVPQDPRLLDRCVECGVGWIRMDFNWCEIEPSEGRFDWARYDRVVDRALQQGLSVFATVAYTPGWANGGADRKVPPSAPGKWERFIETAVRRYSGKIHHWGMWNEPNLRDYGNMSPDEYIEKLLLPGAAAVRRANPAAKVVGPELAHDNAETWAKWLDRVLARAGSSIDIVSHHLYKDEFDKWNGYFSRLDGWRTQLGPLFGKPTLRGILKKRNAAGKPVWITESGWNAAKLGEAKQARCLKEWVLGLRSFPWIERVFLYELHDDPKVSDWEFGLLRGDMTPRGLFGAYKDAIRGNT